MAFIIHSGLARGGGGGRIARSEAWVVWGVGSTGSQMGFEDKVALKNDAVWNRTLTRIRTKEACLQYELPGYAVFTVLISFCAKDLPAKEIQ